VTSASQEEHSLLQESSGEDHRKKTRPAHESALLGIRDDSRRRRRRVHDRTARFAIGQYHPLASGALLTFE
jgi:hypothetical protein